jgi:hypothetical protein
MEPSTCGKIEKYSMFNPMVKVNFTPEQVMKAQRGSRVIALLFL